MKVGQVKYHQDDSSIILGPATFSLNLSSWKILDVALLDLKPASGRDSSVNIAN